MPDARLPSLRPKALLAVLASVMVAALGGGCAQSWSFAERQPHAAIPAAKSEVAATGALPYGPVAQCAHSESTAAEGGIEWPADAQPRPASHRAVEAPLETPWQAPAQLASYTSSDEPLYTPLNSPMLEAANMPPAESVFAPPAPSIDARWALRRYWDETKYNVVADHRNYYSWRTALHLGVAVGLAAPVANTSLDHDFRDWYQQDVRSEGTDSLSSFWKPFGEGKIFIPAWAGLALVGNMFDDRPAMSLLGEFGDRTTRAYLVGGPPMLLMQWTLGASRPGETDHDSHWRAFDDTNSVSGHAFIGAVPFLTAANMAENPWVKGTFYALSAFPAWSRVNDDRHYLSQIGLGWYMAYLAARAVNDTEGVDRNCRVVPIVTPQMTGLGLVLQR
jgi:membrane-associated phospholipid phosphatase